LQAKTLYDKIWDAHVVSTEPDGTCLIYIDRHLVHEVTSAQAFEGLRIGSRKVRRPELTLAVVDHNIPTSDRSNGIDDPESKLQVDTLRDNTKEFGVEYYDETDIRQGIVHIIGPEQGFTLPGTTVVCGDSHTATHGAFGALAHGIGTSEVEHVLASQTLLQNKSKNMLVKVNGKLGDGITAKDLTLAVIARTGTAGGTGHVIEYAGEAIRNLTMEGRMTLCNMAIEGGARAGLVAPDWDDAVAYWKTLKSDPDAHFDIVIEIDAADIAPVVTWGTSPEDALAITDKVPAPEDFADEHKQAAAKRSLEYMGLEAGTPLSSIPIDRVFIGSCTNGRIEDLRAVASVVEGRKIADSVSAMVVPGSGLVKKQAEDEGIADILKTAGFDWREPGCSMCLGMNPDRLEPGERCASTSNRNFEGRQGHGGRTHLMSPAMAAAAAITGHLTDVRTLEKATAGASA